MHFIVLLSMCGAGGPHVQSVASFATQLSAGLGQTIEVDRKLRSVPILIDEPGRSSAQQLKDLVFALHASVVRDGKVLRIERTVKDRAEVAEVHHMVIRQRVEASLLAYDQLLKRSATLGDEAAQIRAAGNAIDGVLKQIEQARAAGRPYAVPQGLVFPGLLSTIGHLNHSLMRRLGPDRLADLGGSGVRFYSDHPNSAELPFTNCGDLLAEFWKNEKREFGSGDRSKLILRVDPNGAGLQIFGKEGRSLVTSYVDYANRVVIYGSGLPVPSTVGGTWRTLDDHSREMASFLTAAPADVEAALMRSDEARSSVEPPKVPDLPDPILNPEREDPLDFAVREGVLSLRRLPKAPALIAVLADGMLEPANALVKKGQIDVSTFEKDLLRGSRPDGVRFEQISFEGTTLLRPTDLLAAEETFVDRALLGQSIRKIVADRRIDINNWTALQFRLFAGRDSGVKRRYTAALMFLGLRSPRDLFATDPRALALIGATLAANRPVVDGSLPPYREILRDAVTQGWLRFPASSGRSDLDVAASTLLASNVLQNCRIGLASSEKPVIDQYDGSKSGFVGHGVGLSVSDALYPSPGTLRTPARTQMFFEAQYLRPRYRVGRQVELTTEVNLGSGLLIRLSLKDSLLERVGQTFAQLPATFRRDIVDGVRNGLLKEGTAVPEFLSDPKLTGP